jgi:WhiB family redox-sensing transcriptional regulator
MPSPQGPNSASAVRVTWRNSAACLDEDPDLSSLSGSRAPRCTAQMTPRPSAVSVRSLRPAGSALWSGQKTRVFGGLSEDERRTLKRRNARSRRAG